MTEQLTAYLLDPATLTSEIAAKRLDLEDYSTRTMTGHAAIEANLRLYAAALALRGVPHLTFDSETHTYDVVTRDADGTLVNVLRAGLSRSEARQRKANGTPFVNDASLVELVNAAKVQAD